MILTAFAELFATKMKPTKCPAKGKEKNEQEEGNKRGQEKAKGKI